MSDMFEESQRLFPQDNMVDNPRKLFDNNNQNTFACNSCNDLALQPILAQCGHLFCWDCLNSMKLQNDYIKNQQFMCTVCKQLGSLTEARPIFGGNNQSIIEGKPKPQYLEPIRNPSGATMESSEAFRLNANVPLGRTLAGYVVMPPSFLQIFNSLQQQHPQIVMNQPEKKVSVISKCLQTSLFAMLTLTIIGILLQIHIF